MACAQRVTRRHLAAPPRFALPGIAPLRFVPLLVAAGSLAVAIPPAAAATGAPAAVVAAGGIHLEYDATMRVRVVAAGEGAAGEGAAALGPWGAGDYLLTPHGRIDAFRLEGRSEDDVQDALGAGHRTTLTGRAAGVVKQVEVVSYAAKPGWLFQRVRYTNASQRPLRLAGYRSHDLRIDPGAGAEPRFWSYQPASYESRPDWVLPVPPGYRRGNFLGMNASDYGGGTPVLDLWRRDAGVAIGHVEFAPRLVSLPVRRDGAGAAEVALEARRERTLAPGESFDTVRSFVAVHRGDYWAALRGYGQAMQAQGLVPQAAPQDAFEPIWCAWGYGQQFTPEQVFESLPVVKRLGFRWAVLDDGWQVALGDWRPMPAKFPAGDADMKALVDRIHAAGLKAQLWWAPLALAPASPTARDHAGWRLLGLDGQPTRISYWNADTLCPAYEPVREEARAFVRKALGEWGFDGLKIDGQHLNGVPACSNASHAHAHPEDSVEQLPLFFKAVWEAAQAAKPGAVVEVCPCGTAYSYFTMPYLNMTVASDPESSWQVRLKGKALKALLGDRTAYFGDHVELSDGGTDFASTFALGGVIGTNFAWRDAPGTLDPKVVLTPAREQAWARWTALYDRLRLVDGVYDGGLYDVRFDVPEAHAVRKGAAMYYGFFAQHWRGALELRGLGAGEYELTDYVHGTPLGRVRGPVARLEAAFEGSLLLSAEPVASP